MTPLETLHDSVENVEQYIDEQQKLIDALVVTAERASRPIWLDMFAIFILAFVYGAWFGVVQCPK
jgi:hypothetical protein